MTTVVFLCVKTVVNNLSGEGKQCGVYCSSQYFYKKKSEVGFTKKKKHQKLVGDGFCL